MDKILNAALLLAFAVISYFTDKAKRGGDP